MFADIVNKWREERLRGGPLARDTAAYNQVFQAIPDLIARLDAAEAQKTPPEPSEAEAPQPEPAAEAASDKE